MIHEMPTNGNLRDLLLQCWEQIQLGSTVISREELLKRIEAMRTRLKEQTLNEQSFSTIV